MIHPIAGKCKHCKGDLAGLRSARPAAAQQLPSIIATNGSAPLNPPVSNGHNGYNGHANGHVNGRANGQAAYAPIPVAAQHVAMPMQLARQYEEHNPILPPRPTGRMQASSAPRTSWWKSWPLIVIVLAVLAIVTAVVLMVFPPGKQAAADPDMKGNKAMPAPERMETNPLPPKADNQPPAKSGDPWDDNNPGSKIDIPDDPDDDLAGGGSSPNNSGGGPGRSIISGSQAVMLEIPVHFCERAATCNNDASLAALCRQSKQVLDNFDIKPPTSCAARQRCLSHIDALDCTFDFDPSTLTSLTVKLQDCVEATTRC